MRRGAGTRFIVPFVLGTLFGALSGVTLGALLGHRVFAGVMYLVSLLRRDDADELRFDLLLQ